MIVAARFWQPWGVAVEGSGTIVVTDTGNHTIRKGVRVFGEAGHPGSP